MIDLAKLDEAAVAMADLVRRVDAVVGPRVSRVNKGIYNITYKGQQYELEQYPDGSWIMFQTKSGGGREYMNDYYTKAAAIAQLVRSLG